tara:strand:+ start:186 stop:1046 length:861 start_codon:yes stop_codon:yes gene_type:complete
MGQVKYSSKNWYLNLKMAEKKQAEKALIESISNKMLGGAFGVLATSIIMTALYRSNTDIYEKVQNQEMSIESAVQQELPNKEFIKEVAKIAPEGAFVGTDHDNMDSTSHGMDEEEGSAASYIHRWEGFLAYPKVLAGEDFYTIGIGHRLDGSDRSRRAFAAALPNKNYNSFFHGRGEIDEDEAQLLFEKDMPDYIKRARKLTGDKFDSYSKNLQKNIISATFRGSWGYSPKTRRLLSEGKYKEAAMEFLNSDEYRNAKELGRPGIIPRMEAVADAIRQEANYQNWN